jgi:hypothetical protein
MAKEKGSVPAAPGEGVTYTLKVTVVDGRGIEDVITIPVSRDFLDALIRTPDWQYLDADERAALTAIEDIASGGGEVEVCSPSPKLELVSRALAGEFEPLISHFESGAELTDKERHTLAKIARGTLPRIGRPPESETETRNRGIVRFAAALKEYGGKRVADVAARKFSIDRSYVSKLIRKYGAEERAAVVFLGGLLDMKGGNDKTVRRVVLGYADVNEDDLREATGRKQVRK